MTFAQRLYPRVDARRPERDVYEAGVWEQFMMALAKFIKGRRHGTWRAKATCGLGFYAGQRRRTPSICCIS
jgi:hypothetical protein